MISSIQNSTKQQLHLRDKTGALWVASNIISEAQVGIIKLNKNIKFQQGTSRIFKQDWHWRAQVIPAGENLFEISVSVKKLNHKEVIFVMQGYLLP